MYIIVFLIGFIFGFSELLNRYKNVKAIFFQISSLIYLVINGGASVLAYFIIEDQKIELGSLGENSFGKVVIAGLSAMVILRSSFLNFKVGDKNYDAGLAMIVQIFLNHADRMFDQITSKAKLTRISPIMNKVEFKDVEKALPLICLSIMQNVPLDEQKRLGEEVGNLSSKSDIDDKVKSLCLGIILEKFVGVELLEKATNTFGNKTNINAGDINEVDLSKLDEMLDKLNKKYE